jgi:hypothetical protein
VLLGGHEVRKTGGEVCAVGNLEQNGLSGGILVLG